MSEELLITDEKPVPPAPLKRRTRVFQIVFAGSVALYALMAVLARVYPYYRWDLRASLLVQSI